MGAAQYDFEIEQGSSFSISIVYKDNNGSVIDITDWCARFTWKTNTNTSLSFSSLNLDYSEYKLTINGPNGQINLQLPATTTNEFDFSSAKYDLELQSDEDFYAGGGKKTYRILYGTIAVVKRYSKSTDLLECQE
jgi:hypothetical protein